MKTDFTIRIARLSDALELKDLFQDTVLNINKRDYSKAEVEDWASCGNDLSHIKEMIKTHYFIVAVNQTVTDCRFFIYHASRLFAFYGKFYQFNLSSCIRQQNSLTAQFVSFSLSNLANIFYPPQFLQ